MFQPDTSKPAVDPAAVDRLRELADGDPQAFLKEIRAAFNADTAKRILSLRQAALDNDGNGLKRAAHAIKGSSLNLGAHQLAEMCRHLEHLGGAGSVANAAEMVTAIEAESERVRVELNKLIET